MQLPKGAIVAVADGEKLRLFRNSGDEADMKLAALPDEAVDGENRGTAHHSSSIPTIARRPKTGSRPERRRSSISMRSAARFTRWLSLRLPARSASCASTITRH
jgi:protein required for attachment to host cells